MPRTMTLAESRARAEQVYIMREIGMKSWSHIRDALGFKSVGAVQNAHKRYAARNPVPGASAAAAGIVERKRYTLGIALTSLAEAHRKGDHRTVAQLLDAITRADAELAKLYGLGSENVNVNVSVTQSLSEIVAEAEQKLLAAIDAEVVDEPKGIGR
ncbi:MAG: hypothetical protein ACRDUS_12950 [Mycobacterium sp.]